ncbi:unnamed protein product [Rotaria sordida]|nr:unnamed protein product [Rotaria sordida]
MAGGAVLNCLLINGFDSSTQDLDFFWLGGSWTSFIAAIDRFERKAKSRILETKNIYGILIEFTLLIDNDHTQHIQFIFGRETSNMSFILYTFDLDIVQVGFDGYKIISTIGFFQAVATRSFISYGLTNDIHDTIYYLDRCFKYNQRGFSWLCPIDYNDFLAQKPLVTEKKIYDYGFNDFYFNVDSFNVQIRFLNFN